MRYRLQREQQQQRLRMIVRAAVGRRLESAMRLGGGGGPRVPTAGLAQLKSTAALVQLAPLYMSPEERGVFKAHASQLDKLKQERAPGRPPPPPAPPDASVEVRPCFSVGSMAVTR